jgi:predicted transglutaminase-like cysteine proteinase
MGILRSLTLATGLFGLQASLASPALAAVGLADGDLSPVLAPVPDAEAADLSCAPRIAPSLGVAQKTLAGTAESKSAAILGRRMSQLEMIAMQQAMPLTAAPTSVDAPSAKKDETLPGEGLEPAAGSRRCLGLARAQSLDTAFAPGTARAPLGREDFLASKRLPISLTSFDAAWNRVDDSALPRGLSRAVGRLDNGPVTRDRIAAINAWTNAKVRYVEDRELYGRADFWATARMTLKRRAGDCEDIAIAKMQLLAAVGVRREDMFLTIARDLARNADHALLVVRHENGYLLLDNATDQLLDGMSSHDYRPIMSFNTSGKWLHGY